MILLLLACAPGTVTLGGVDTASIDDTASTDDTGEVHDPDGSYGGRFEVSVWWKAWEYGVSCDGDDAEVQVEDGEVSGWGECKLDIENRELLFTVLVSGDLDEELQLEGEALILLNEGVREDESGSEGDFSAGTVTLGGDGDMTAYNETMDYEWLMELERE